MEATNFSNATYTGQSYPGGSPLMALLETTIPGISLITRSLSEYLKIDLSQYLGSLLFMFAFTAGFNHYKDSVIQNFSEYFMASAHIRYNDEMYNYLMYWVARNGVSEDATHFIAGTKTNSDDVYDHEADSDDDVPEEFEDMMEGDQAADQYRNWDKMKVLRFTPSIGQHYFRYKGRWLVFNRYQEKEKGLYGSTTTEELFISCFGRNPQILKELLQEAQVTYLERDGNKTVIYRGAKTTFGEDMEWIRCMSRPPRPMSTVVLDEAQKKIILDDMKEYLHPRTKKWYSNRGIPYRRGYLMEGPPGTGKTSLCFALAGLLQLRIYVASLNAKSMTEDSLATLFRELPSRCIVLLEDIDSAGLVNRRDNSKKFQRSQTQDEVANTALPTPAPTPNPATRETENENINKGISLSGFLNIIDGVASSEGRILVMTTNHIEKLDPALMRPGRVDMTIHFRLADFAMIRGLFKAIYSTLEAEPDVMAAKDSQANGAAKESASLGPGFAHHGRSDAEIAELAEKFAEGIPAGEFSPAEVQGYLLKHKMNPVGAIQGLGRWMEERREEKKIQE